MDTLYGTNLICGTGSKYERNLPAPNLDRESSLFVSLAMLY